MKSRSITSFAVLTTSALILSACATPRSTPLVGEPIRTPAATEVSGIAQVDYEFPKTTEYPPFTLARKIQSGRPDDTSQFYFISKPNGMNPNNVDHFSRIYTDGRADGKGDSDTCRIASAVQDFKTVTNPEFRFTAVYLQKGNLYGVYKSEPYRRPVEYTPFCTTGPTKTESLAGNVVKDANGKYQYWTYLPGPTERAEQALALFYLSATPSTNLTVYSGDGRSSTVGTLDEAQINPCFHMKGKPYQSFVLFTHYRNEMKVSWTDPASPHDTYKNKSQERFTSINEFMKKMKISNDGGKTCL